MRTHHCNELRPAHIDQSVTLVGWVNTTRDHGGVIFIDLRDREGLTQVVFRPEENADLAEKAHQLRQEDVIQIHGIVAARLKTADIDTTNSELATGEIEIVATDFTILNKSQVLPFQLDKTNISEDNRLKHRYLDLRTPRMTRNLRLRHRIAKATRDFLDERGFLEIETPILSKSTPEGARDFLVPSRLHAGKFYALPQAPQQYKQLLMCGGIEKYFQIARCFRDEDLRSDRQPEFTQIDIEASFVTQEDLIHLIEGLLQRIFRDSLGTEIPASFDRLSYQEAMNRYGSDKPDRRYGMELQDISSIFTHSSFKVFSAAVNAGGCVKAINAKGFSNISVGQVDKLTQMAKEAGAKGLAYIQAREEDPSTWRSPITKFFSEEELLALKTAMNIEPGDLILFGAGDWSLVCDVLGRIRIACAEYLNLLENNQELNFLWVTDFPLLAYDEEEGRWAAVHHPFTRPNQEGEANFKAGNYAGVNAQAYDVVLNGYELGGGSIRIHESELQSKMFEALGISVEEAQEQFGHILEAFSFGAPPHGGIALGLDRISMLVAGENSIREVIAFPKTNRGQDLMSDSPAKAETRQLRDVHIECKLPKKAEKTEV